MIRRSFTVQHPARLPIKPGMLLRIVITKVSGQKRRTEAWVTPHDVRGGSVSNKLPLFALPHYVEGREPYDAYAAGEQVYATAAGDCDIDVLLAGGQQVFSGSPLVSNGDGTLVHWHAVPGAAMIIATALEDVDLDGLPARIIKARVRI